MFRILIVDDEQPVRALVSRLLSAKDLVIEEAAGAEEAMRCLATTTPDVAVIDVHMPGANGLWLADRIRNLSPATAVILLTGDEEVPAVESLRPGITAYLLKPPHRSELVRAVDDAINWSSSRPSRHRSHLLHSGAGQ